MTETKRFLRIADIEQELVKHGRDGGRWVPEDADWGQKILISRCKCGDYYGEVANNQDDANLRRHIAGKVFSAAMKASPAALNEAVS